ncbi:metallophosphoesterase, PPA1498 family [Lentzea fradiae]|uniref:Metallophosphoesterase, PPA1498 family n=1 Tax=Lentzea fradiae TaxID=200378 RepID=A0A1G7PS27_9PSEU|nr:TIGR03767 family metallophosphoesterase [Lentzea fradiae]SDF89045.1 metallophosphoesterase, PPA1498 family [Lentzea fradiae]
MTGFSRRSFLLAMGAGAAGVPLLDRQAVASTAGTTLETTATPIGTAGYRRLTAGPGWPTVVRDDLIAAMPNREARRRALASFVQFSDMHICDAQSPLRFEYLHPILGSSAHRPQETLTAQGSTALVKRVNAVRNGPITGRPFDCLVTTGDNTDNHEMIELDWFFSVLNGGRITPNTGDSRYEGVQNAGISSYWQPELSGADDYKAKGFPHLEGLFDAALRPFTSPGLDIPWFSTMGNHDDNVGGAWADGLLDGWYTGSKKIMGFGDPVRDAKVARAFTDPTAAPEALSIIASQGVVRTVTPDDRRRLFTTGEFVRKHLETGGHGYTDANADGVDVFYTFRIAPGVTGISMDTTNVTGFSEGSIGLHQLNWVERTLKRNSSLYYDWLGLPQRQNVTDELFVLFSHHTSKTMINIVPDKRRPLDPRMTGDALVNLLHRFPNVVAWVNGHTHRNVITPHRHSTPSRGFWEINTAAHVDYPQHARVIEVADNGDGTLSLFTTLLEADSPYQVDYDDRDDAALASLCREFTYNDIHSRTNPLGTPLDRNTELLVTVR